LYTENLEASLLRLLLRLKWFI